MCPVIEIEENREGRSMCKNFEGKERFEHFERGTKSNKIIDLNGNIKGLKLSSWCTAFVEKTHLRHPSEKPI